MRMKLFFKIIFIFSFIQPLLSQSFVPDSSFENNRTIPQDFSAISNSYTWSRPSMGTTDLFCANERKKKKYSMVDVPNNALGFQKPHSGNCYAGFFLFSHGDYREYLQTPLTSPLEKNKTYLFSVYINLANYSQTYIDQIGFCFDTTEHHYPIGDVLTELNPVYIKMGRAGSDTARWNKITALYKAKGGETYLIFGSFNINKVRKTGFSFPKRMKTIINKSSLRDAYYFVDDVSLIEMINVPEVADSIIHIGKDTLDNISSEMPLVLKSVLFETNKSTVLAPSFPDLDKLAEYLIKNPTYKIEISGHTDNTGSDDLNKKLSEERARQVAKYLMKSGVTKKRITVFGYGTEKPLFPNDKEEHKSANRRVEVIFIK